MRHHLKHLTGLLRGILVSLTLGGCASVSVQRQSAVSSADAAKARRPERIVVEAFTFPASERIRADREGAELAAFERNLQTRMQNALVAEIGRLGLSAAVADVGQGKSSTLRAPGKSRESVWVVKGQFTRVNQGSRALRVVIGLGAGGTKMETAVQVYDLSQSSREPALAFRTTGGSNAEPGLIGAGGPVTGPVGVAVTAVNVVSTAASSGGHGVSEDARRTARMIAAYLSEDLARRGYLDPAKVRRAKRLGREDSSDHPAPVR